MSLLLEMVVPLALFVFALLCLTSFELRALCNPRRSGAARKALAVAAVVLLVASLGGNMPPFE